MEDDECVHGLGDPAWCVLCNGREKREKAASRTVSYTFKAKFTGRCGACHEEWHPGDELARTEDDGIIHLACAEA